MLLATWQTQEALLAHESWRRVYNPSAFSICQSQMCEEHSAGWTMTDEVIAKTSRLGSAKLSRGPRAIPSNGLKSTGAWKLEL